MLDALLFGLCFGGAIVTWFLYMRYIAKKMGAW